MYPVFNYAKALEREAAVKYSGTWKVLPFQIFPENQKLIAICGIVLAFIGEVMFLVLQVIPSVINGVITALYFILWGKGVKSCGPLR